MDPLERRRIVSDYVSDRLVRECKGTWGKAIDVARKTGFSSAHITNVMNRQRTTGDDFAMAVAKYWGIEYAEMERLAVEHAAAAYSRERSERSGERRDLAPPSIALRPEPEDLHPILTAALAYCRSKRVYPLDYLDEYEREARRLPEDRPREVWMADLQVKFWEWKQSQKLGKQKPGPEKSEISRKAARKGASATKPGVRTPEKSGVTSKDIEQPPQRGVKSR